MGGRNCGGLNIYIYIMLSLYIIKTKGACHAGAPKLARRGKERKREAGLLRKAFPLPHPHIVNMWESHQHLALQSPHFLYMCRRILERTRPPPPSQTLINYIYICNWLRVGPGRNYPTPSSSPQRSSCEAAAFFFIIAYYCGSWKKKFNLYTQIPLLPVINKLFFF